MRTARIVIFFLSIALSLTGKAEDSVSQSLTTQAPDASLRRFEVGGQIAGIRTGCVGQGAHCGLPSFAVGSGATLNLTPHLAIDANFNITPTTASSSTNLDGGHASEFLVGVRAEMRAKHYGFFLKAQPGYFRWDHVITNATTWPFSFGSRYRFASAVGAGFEYSPAARIHLRADVSDFLIRHSSALWINNLQPTAGIYVGVGKPIEWQLPTYNPKAAHSFTGRSNLILVMGSVLGMTADAITTQRFIAHGQREGDPFARPLVKYGWSGEISAVSLEIAAQSASMYGMHRMGQHWAERMLPACLAITHGILAYNNTKVSSNKPVK